MKKRIVFIAALALLTLFSCKSKKDAAPPPGQGSGAPAPVISVEGLVIKTSSINEIVEASGTILANEATEIRPEISGRITQLNIREGAVVPKGSLLVKIYDGDL
ncbi:MAG: biotin/lipoyl-binding protein, partial [Sphingobacteriales bacterium]